MKKVEKYRTEIVKILHFFKKNVFYYFNTYSKIHYFGINILQNTHTYTYFEIHQLYNLNL